MSRPPDCDLFCRVIDNYGDIGVCWRLAQQLCNEHGWRVRLWVDDTNICSQLQQAPLPEGIELQVWRAAFPEVMPAAVVIEAFACELPANFLTIMASMPKAPVWINLEYLCVEDWGPGFHLQPSPHPRLPLLKHFFVPGILTGTGGLLREVDLATRQNHFNIAQARHRYAADTSGLWSFMFCYDNPALLLLLDAWVENDTPMHCLVGAGKANWQVAAWLGHALPAGEHVQRGKLHLHGLPFVPQQDFDNLLWMSDINFVRGEDSFCRAQWAGRPFIWHIYPQQEAAHYDKLAAFYKHYGVQGQTDLALANFNALWNGLSNLTQPDMMQSWRALAVELPALTAHAEAWRRRLEPLGDLAANLANFCRKAMN